ncbi:MAG: phosphomannose isomerase type II C-terminal cupin domain [Candidatus Gastranaerophilaceae bacterium]|jgi:mannose-6-phosphate isomerase-like protein (cupin superfamily)
METTNLYTEQRPWGYFTILAEGNGYKVKKILVYPNQRLSLQKHIQRAEQWIVAEGSPYIVNDNSAKTYKVGDNIFIPHGAVHRIENRSEVPAIVIEVQIGSYLGEDDIIRLEDDYKR